jgi:hypothetical protein
VFGHERAKAIAEPSYTLSWQSVEAPQDFIYHIRSGAGPRVFLKVEPPEPELRRMLANSPLRAHRTTPTTLGLPSPPLALGIGHVALLLASGHLDGVVEPEGRLPHVVRGTSRKREYVADVTETANEDGTTTTKTTIAEKIELVVRTVDLTGNIQTFHDAATAVEAVTAADDETTAREQ